MFGTKKISSVHAREILDSRGNPTVACRVTLRNGFTAESRVPSGASTGSHEALELRDGGKRYGGKGVQKAVKHVNDVIASVLIGVDVTRQQDIDHVMMELDGTPNKSELGANAILSVSLACAQAAALARAMPLWKSLRATYQFDRPAALPMPTMNVLNGGAHAGWTMDVQELMLVPKRKTVSERIRVGAEVFHALGRLLKEGGHSVAVGDEGGFAPKLGRPEDALACMAKAVDAAGYSLGKDVYFAADVASSEFYDAKKKRYVLRAEKIELTSEALLERYAGWMEQYPFESIEDPFAEDDWSAWTEALPVFEGAEVRVVGDDLLVTNVERLSRAIEE